MFALIVADIEQHIDSSPPDVHGPFNSVEDAQAYAEAFRTARGLPAAATPENNEAWTEAGWWFGIVPMSMERRWYFYSTDEDRSAPWSNHCYGFTAAFFGNGVTAQDALTEAQSAKRDDYAAYAEWLLSEEVDNGPVEDTLTAIPANAEQGITFTVNPTEEG